MTNKLQLRKQKKKKNTGEHSSVIWRDRPKSHDLLITPAAFVPFLFILMWLDGVLEHLREGILCVHISTTN